MTIRTMALNVLGNSPDIPHRSVSGVLLILTKVKIALETVRGTWLSDVLFGLPYDVWAENPSTSTVEIDTEIRMLILSVPGVIRIDSLSVSRSPSLSVDASITVEGSEDSVKIEARKSEELSDNRLIIAFYASLETSELKPEEFGVRKGSKPRVAIELPGDAYIIVDPLNNPGTISGTDYLTLPDLSGNGRDMFNSGAVQVTSTAYPVRSGIQALPEGRSTRTMTYGSPGTIPTNDFTIFCWGPHETGHTNTASLGAFWRHTSSLSPSFSVRYSSTSGGTLDLTDRGIGSPLAGAPIPAFPASGNSSFSWWAYVVRREGLKWTWIMVADLDDGSGVYKVVDSTFTVASGADADIQSRMDNCAGVSLQNSGSFGKESGGCAAYRHAVDASLVKGALAWCAGRFSESAESATKELLGI